MRQDQFEALQARKEQLIDVFLAESNPDAWPGAGIAPAAMEKTTRGDRYWCKKDAVATLACAMRIEMLVVAHQRPDQDALPPAPGSTEETASPLDAEVAAAEKEAERLLDQVQRGARKAAFDKHTLGKG